MYGRVKAHHVVDDAHRFCYGGGLEAGVRHAVDELLHGDIAAPVVVEVDALHPPLCDAVWQRAGRLEHSIGG